MKNLNLTNLKTFLIISAIIIFLTLAIVTQNPIEDQLFSSFAIILGAYLSYINR